MGGEASKYANTITYLKQGEPLPDGEPRRYPNPRGYVLLRWKLAPYCYVETWERNSDGSLMRTIPSRAKVLDGPEIVRLYNEGRSQPEIAAQLGCNVGAVSRVLRRHGGKARVIHPGLPDGDKDAAIALYQAGRSLQAVGREVGRGTGWVTRVVAAAGVQRTPSDRVYASWRSRRRPTNTYEAEFIRVRSDVNKRSRGLCEGRVAGVCTGQAAHVHHRKLRRQGGDNSLANLLDLCPPCHLWAHAHPKEAVESGLIVLSWDVPVARNAG